MKRWGADAIRDCDGTEFPEELKKTWMNIIASGGVKDLKDLEAIKNTGACGVILW